MDESGNQASLIVYFHEDDTLTCEKISNVSNLSSMDIGATCVKYFKVDAKRVVYTGIVVHIARGIRHAKDAKQVLGNKTEKDVKHIVGRIFATKKGLVLTEKHVSADYVNLDWKQAREVLAEWTNGNVIVSEEQVFVPGLLTKHAAASILDVTTGQDTTPSARIDRLKKRTTKQIAVIEEASVLKLQVTALEQKVLGLEHDLLKRDGKIRSLDTRLKTLQNLFVQVQTNPHTSLVTEKTIDSVADLVAGTVTAEELSSYSPKGGSGTDQPALDPMRLQPLYNEFIPLFIQRNKKALETLPKLREITRVIHRSTSYQRDKAGLNPKKDKTKQTPYARPSIPNSVQPPTKTGGSVPVYTEHGQQNPAQASDNLHSGTISSLLTGFNYHPGQYAETSDGTPLIGNHPPYSPGTYFGNNHPFGPSQTIQDPNTNNLFAAESNFPFQG